MHVTETIAYRTAKGGQGCTTVALVHALKHVVEDGRLTLLLTDSIEDVAAMLGTSINEDGGISYGKLEVQPIVWGLSQGWDAIIVDAGTSDVPYRAEATVLVTKNCYLALKRAFTIKDKIHSVLLILEEGRPLGLEDVEALFDCKVTATTYDVGMANIIDAGLVGLRMPQVS